GKAIKAAGYSYVSVSDEAVMEDCIQMSDYKTIDFIFGEEKETDLPDKSIRSFFKIFPKKLKEKIEDYCDLGGDLFISGAYLGSAMFATPRDTTIDTRFAREILKYQLETRHAVRNGKVFTADTNFAHMDFEFEFNTKFSKNIYKVEAPDAIVPANKDSAQTILRYKENRFSAGIGYQSNKYDLVLTAFPFETILGEKARILFMQYVLDYLKNEE
ncbi:MAG: xanthan lyase, partial [Candidatus Marinimicrobia bacterium]|nr:xanthan lyase [Candidatus Neomarinimicrobiota bacterium]